MRCGQTSCEAFLTMLGIIIGVGAVITMVAIGSGAQRRVNEQIESSGTNVLTIRAWGRDSQIVSTGAGTASYFSDDDVQAIRNEVSNLVAAGRLYRNECPGDSQRSEHLYRDRWRATSTTSSLVAGR